MKALLKRLNSITIFIITGVMVALTGLLIFFFVSYTKTLSRTESDVTYDKYYAMITDDAESSFWKSVYESALETAKEDNAYVEMISNNLSREYSQTELMEIAIASKVDGIIVTAGEAEGMTELINKAYDEGIPVVTLFNDNAQSERLSFVGVGNYNLGREYGNLIIKMANERIFLGNHITVAVLVDASSEDSGQNVLAAGIQETIDRETTENAIKHKRIEVELVPVDASNSFSVEESVRNLFLLGPGNIPDIVVCLNENETNSVYQGVVDYNQVGFVNILGYYDSEAILKGIERDVIYATLSIDTQQLGQYCIDALTEYYELGNTSQYSAVDSYVINKKNVAEYMGEAQNEE
ncbi:ribose transport system substrate-binding protein [Lachnospiraceae bacterium YSD2013]|nr:ribose transport system substrate-binding protein [Lachnospiraceae bacterium YSD2013]